MTTSGRILRGPAVRRALGAAVVVPLALAACEAPPEHVPIDADAHRARVQAFHDARVAELSAPDSWLSLIALHWVEDGEVTMGSDASNELVLPAGKAAAFVGRVVQTDSALMFYAQEGARVTMGVDSTINLSAGSGAFPPDVSADPVVTQATLGSAGRGKYVVLRHGDLNWIGMRRGDRYAIRLRDNSSAVYDRFDGIDRYPIAAAWRVTARWVPHEKTVAVPNVLGTVSELASPAHLAFWIDDVRHTIDVTDGADSDKFMLVFADATSGDETYGGGRYVWVDPPDEQGRVVLDFNLAYNPPCVWTDFATCPLPTRDNRLSIPVLAGEKDWTH